MNKKLKKAYKRFLYLTWKPFWYGKVKRFPWELRRLILWLWKKHQCFYCHIMLVWRDYTVDHYIPKSKGGTNAFSNMRICCARCNRIKSDKMPTPGLIKHLYDVRLVHPR